MGCLPHKRKIDSPDPNSLNSDKVKGNLTRGLRKLLIKKSLYMHSAETQLMGVFRKEEWGTEDCTGLKLYLPCLIILIFKKRTTKADCMSGHILALRVIFLN